MVIDFSATWKRQHCVLWLEGARTAWRTKSCIWDATLSDDGIPGSLSARAALCSALPDEQASNDGAVVAQAAARSKCRLKVIWHALMGYSGKEPTMPDPAKSVCSLPNTQERSAVFHLKLDATGRHFADPRQCLQVVDSVITRSRQ